MQKCKSDCYDFRLNLASRITQLSIFIRDLGYCPNCYQRENDCVCE